MCEYCNPKKYKDDYYGNDDFDRELEIEYNCYTSLCMLWNSKTNKFGICAIDEGEAATNINFCPKCGRKL